MSTSEALEYADRKSAIVKKTRREMRLDIIESIAQVGIWVVCLAYVVIIALG